MSAGPTRRRHVRASSVVSEAWRNLVSGTTRPVLLTLVAVSVLGGLAVADVRAVVGLSVRATEFRTSGAAVRTLSAPGAVSGPRCDALGSLPGVVGAGATRQPVAQASFLTAPRSGIATVEATVGLAGVLGVTDGYGTGAWLSASAAETLGAQEGTTVPTSLGPVIVRARYAYPTDASDRTLAHAAVATVPASGLFDTCWVLAWPQSQAVDTLLRGTYDGDPGAQSTATLGQLSTRLGATFDGPGSFGERSTSGAPVVAALFGLVLGVGCVWARRLELAGALHAQVPKPALVAQVGLELVTVMAAAVLVTLPVTFALAVHDNPDPMWPAWSAGLRVAGAGALAVVVGGLAATATTSEKRLFRYFTDR